MRDSCDHVRVPLFGTCDRRTAFDCVFWKDRRGAFVHAFQTNSNIIKLYWNKFYFQQQTNNPNFCACSLFFCFSLILLRISSLLQYKTENTATLACFVMIKSQYLVTILIRTFNCIESQSDCKKEECPVTTPDTPSPSLFGSVVLLKNINLHFYFK